MSDNVREIRTVRVLGEHPPGKAYDTYDDEDVFLIEGIELGDVIIRIASRAVSVSAEDLREALDILEPTPPEIKDTQCISIPVPTHNTWDDFDGTWRRYSGWDLGRVED